MKQVTLTNTAFVAAAGNARPAAGRGFCAYPWHVGGTRAGQLMTRIDVITESKFHHRWPGDPSS